ncbi:MAG: hypothetical protein LBS22_02505 [Puniceicoccales bacterium]|jgi:hypothetical protein|nr:hypothetical protein [Puniceicoccales bacterium]
MDVTIRISQEFVNSIVSKEKTEVTSIFGQLEFAFETPEKLTKFANDTLGLTDFPKIQSGDLAKIKTQVMADLAHARAKNHEFLKSPTGVGAWLRNLLMSFAMWVCARSNAEKLFEQNETTTEAMKRTLGSILLPNPNPEAPSVPPASTSDAPEDFTVVGLPETQPTLLEIAEDIMSHLKVVDTPRDGSCMLWSVLAGLTPPTEAQPAEASSGVPTDVSQQMAITNAQGKISDDKVLLARDVTIPELRQIISMGIIAEQNNDSEAREIEAGGFGAKRIKPEQMKYIAKHLERDIAIITKQGGQSVAYLCTKEGKVVTSQDEGFSKEKFEAALRNGPAIFAEDEHARCLKYSAQASEQTNV